MNVLNGTDIKATDWYAQLFSLLNNDRGRVEEIIKKIPEKALIMINRTSLFEMVKKDKESKGTDSDKFLEAQIAVVILYRIAFAIEDELFGDYEKILNFVPKLKLEKARQSRERNFFAKYFSGLSPI